MELFEAIRRDRRREELSIRELATRYRVLRRTVRLALDSAQPPPRKAPERSAPKLELIAPLIDVMLRVDLHAPRKEQHTARQVLARLLEEHGVRDVSYRTVRDYVARRRPAIAAGESPASARSALSGRPSRTECYWPCGKRWLSPSGCPTTHGSRPQKVHDHRRAGRPPGASRR